MLTPKQLEKKRAATRAWNRRNLDRGRLVMQRQNERNKREVLTAYGKNEILQCCWLDCEVTDVDMLTLDHVFNDGAAERKSGVGKGIHIYRKLRQQGFPKGRYQTLCANHQLKKAIRVKTDSRKDAPMKSWTVRVEQYLEEGRSVSGGKVDQTAKDAEKAQASFTGTLQQAFKTQFAKQQGVLDFLRGKLEPGITNPQGFDQATKTALNSNAIENNAVAFQNATKSEQAQAAAHGDATSLPSGVQEQIQGQIAGQAAGQKAGALGEIQLQDAQLKQQNYWNSVNALNGVSAQVNPLGYAGDANAGAGETANLSNAVSSSQQVGFWNNLGNSFAGSLGSSLGGVKFPAKTEG